MREHSGAEGKNNMQDPTIRELEKAKGTSGEAITGEKKNKKQPSRESTVRA